MKSTFLHKRKTNAQALVVMGTDCGVEKTGL